MSDSGPDYGGASSDIYTVLTVIATLFLILGTVMLAVRSQALFDSWLPFGGA